MMIEVTRRVSVGGLPLVAGDIIEVSPSSARTLIAARFAKASDATEEAVSIVTPEPTLDAVDETEADHEDDEHEEGDEPTSEPASGDSQPTKKKRIRRR